MNIFFIALKFYIYFFLTIISSIIIGNTLLEILPVKRHQTKIYTFFFYRILIGIVIITVVYSLIITVFKTINVLFLFIFIYFFFLEYKKENIKNSISIDSFIHSTIRIFKYSYLLILISIPIFLFEAIILLKSGEMNISLPFADYIYYADLSSLLRISGEENKFLLTNIYFDSFHGLTPYHYFELWINSFLSFIYSESSVVCLILLTYPIFYFATLLAIISSWENFGKINKIKIGISFLLLFTGGIYFSFYNNFELLKYHGGIATQILSVQSKKLAIITPFMFLSMQLLITKRKLQGFLVLLSVIIIAVGVLPGVIGGTVIFLIINFWHKMFSKKELLKILMMVFLFSLAFASVYLLLGNKNSSTYGVNSMLDTFLDTFSISNIKNIIFKTIFPGFRMVFMYVPFILFIVFVFNKNKYNKNFILGKLFILVLCMLLVANLTGGISYKLYSGGQFFCYLIPSFIVLSVLFFIYYYKDLEISSFSKIDKKNIILYLFILILLYNAFCNISFNLKNKYRNIQLYSDTYLKEITNYLDKNNLNPYGVSFVGEKDTRKYPLGLNASGLAYTGFSLKLSKNYFGTTNLSIFNLPIDTIQKTDKDYFKIFEFYNFVQYEKNKKSFNSITESQINFIDKYNIEYAIKYKYAELPKELQKRIKIQITDSLSGESFIIFNRAD